MHRPDPSTCVPARPLDPDYLEQQKPGLTAKQQDDFIIKSALKARVDSTFGLKMFLVTYRTV